MDNQKVNLSTLKGYALEIINTLEESGGELTETTEKALTLINEKLLGGCYAIDNRRGAIADKKAMIKELQASIKRDEKSLDFLEGAVLGAMSAVGTSKIESYKKFTVAKRPGRVKVEGDDLPVEFLKTVLTVKFDLSNESELSELEILSEHLGRENINFTVVNSPNKTAIKEAIKRGEVVPGAQLIEHETSLRIK